MVARFGTKFISESIIISLKALSLLIKNYIMCKYKSILYIN